MRMSNPYLAATLFIIGWWAVGLREPSYQPKERPNLVQAHHPVSDSFLSLLSRAILEQALKRDFLLMNALIQEWDLEAQLLLQKGVEGIQRLSLNELLEAVELGKSLKLAPTPLSSQSYFPQDWASSGLLLTLLHEKEIAALPEGYIPFYPVRNIPFLKGDITSFFWDKKPDLALVAPYTAPKVISSLKALNIPLYHQTTLWSLEDCFKQIEAIGKIVQKPRESLLLILFMKSALMNMDNRLKQLPQDSRTLFLEQGLTLHIPTQKLLSGQLARRLNLNLAFKDPKGHYFKVPLSYEEIRKLHPKRLIIAVEDKNLFKPPHELGEVEIVLVEERPINVLDPTLILGYYDLYEAILK